MAMLEQIGTTAGAIWRVLETKGEMTVPALKKEVQGKAPLFDWAIGWLAREDKIEILNEKRVYRVHLKGVQAKGAVA